MSDSAATTALAPPSSEIGSAQLRRNFAIAGILICPTLIALPPRKLDFYTFSLMAVFAISVSESGLLKRRSAAPSAWMRSGLAKGEEPSGVTGGVESDMAGVKGLFARAWYGRATTGTGLMSKESWKEKLAEEEKRRLENGSSVLDEMASTTREVFGIEEDADEDED